eukprot:g29794.t1
MLPSFRYSILHKKKHPLSSLLRILIASIRSPHIPLNCSSLELTWSGMERLASTRGDSWSGGWSGEAVLEQSPAQGSSPGAEPGMGKQSRS